MNILLSGDWIIETLGKIFLTFMDWCAYSLLTVSYNIFDGVAQLDLFGGSDAGQTLYDNITRRVYVVLSIVMVFMFAYQLLMLIANPDGKGKGASGALVKDTIISIVLLIALPLVYKYMAIFQYHVLNDGTIAAIIMGTNASDSDHNPGQNIALMTFMSFYHPVGTSYDTFFNESGDIDENALTNCTSSEDDGVHPTEKVCKAFIAALEGEQDTNGGLWGIMMDSDLRDYIGEDDGMWYYWLLSTVAGLAAAYFFFVYAFDVGIRAVKLGALEIISPIPVVFRIFPQTKKTFDNWFRVIKKTYLELFARVAIIFFGIELIKMIPTFVKILASSGNKMCASGFTKCVSYVILILSILAFCKQAPQMFKEIFDMGGDLLKGMFNSAGHNLVKGAVYGATTGDGIKDSVNGALRGGIGGMTTDYKTARKNLDIYRTETANGSKFGGRTIDRLRGIVGMETRGEQKDRMNKRRVEGVFHTTEVMENNKQALDHLNKINDIIKESVLKGSSKEYVLSHTIDASSQNIINSEGINIDATTNLSALKNQVDNAKKALDIDYTAIVTAKYTDKNGQLTVAPDVVATEAAKMKKDAMNRISKLTDAYEKIERGIIKDANDWAIRDNRIINSLSDADKAKIAAERKQVDDLVSGGRVGVVYDDNGNELSHVVSLRNQDSSKLKDHINEANAISAEHGSVRKGPNDNKIDADKRMVLGQGKQDQQ